MLKKGDYMCKLDLKDAYFSLPLNPRGQGALQVSLPLFRTRRSTKNFYKITQNSSFSVASPEHTNYNSLGRHVVDRPYNRRNARDTVIFLLEQLWFALNL